MQLTEKAHAEIKSKSLVGKLADALKVSPYTIYRYIKLNSDDLTKAAALEVIREETGLPDSEILEEEPKAVPATK